MGSDITRKKALWERIQTYDFENLVPESLMEQIFMAFEGEHRPTQAFAAKLSRKHHWTQEFAMQAVSEYKRFVFLGMISPTEVTPSTTIDVVWHEHQLFTRGYREFCEEVLRRNFDHSPELLSTEAQTGRFSAQYLATLELYRQEFNMEPPSAIWGTPKFDPKKVEAYAYAPVEKRAQATPTDDTPLFLLYPMPVDSNPHQDFSVGDGGRSGGAGASGSWEAPAPTPVEAPSVSVDTSNSDSAGVSCGSSCSASSCGGGGGCGGGGCGG